MDAAVATVIVGFLVAIPATISAVASIRNGKDMKTNHGKRPGEYIELTAAAALDHSMRLESMESKLEAHLDSDNLNFAEIRRMLEAQNIAMGD